MQDYNTASPDKPDECLNRQADTEKLISYIYNVLQNINAPSSEVYKRAWEDDLGQQISDDLRDESVQYIHTCCINARHCLIQFKVLHRLYYSKSKLNKIFPNVSPLCNKCQLQEATLTHSFVLCPKIESLWTEIFSILSNILKIPLEPDSKLIVLGKSVGTYKIDCFSTTPCVLRANSSKKTLNS